MKDETKKIEFIYNLRKVRWLGITLFVIFINYFEDYFWIDWGILLPVIIVLLLTFEIVINYQSGKLMCPKCGKQFHAATIATFKLECMNCGKKLED